MSDEIPWEDKEVANLEFVEIKGADRVTEDGAFEFTDEDWLLYGLLTDPVFMPELLWKDPQNRAYGGCYRVRDYQYQLNRCDENYAIFACSRAIGKTESEKVHAEIHGFDGNTEGQSMLITAPELIHLLPLADAIEDHIRDCRLLREMLDLSGGQAQPLTAKILTPDGWKRLGELQVGSKVIGVNGKATMIDGVFPQGKRPVYEIEFMDGSKTTADASHKWEVQTSQQRRRCNPTEIKTTIEIAEALDRSGTHNGSHASPWHTPHVRPVEFAVGKHLPIDPYLLGVLLGDGGLSHPTSVRVSTIDGQLLELIHPLLPTGMGIVHEDRCNYRLTAGGRGKAHRNPLMTLLREMELLGKRSHEKHVPTRYLLAAPSERLALLQGLVDTDGHVTDKGSVEFTSTSPALAEAVHFLACSLGGTCSRTIRQKHLRGVRHRDSHRLRFRLASEMEPCRLDRKRARLRSSRNAATRAIRRITPLGTEVEMACIHIADPAELYVTDDFIVTHNTGFTHRPFGVNWLDGTKLIGRIPRLMGTGLKGMHAPRLIMEEAQDYPEKGWIEINETVNYDSTGPDGKPNFRFWIYGVHGGNKASGFDERARSNVWRKTHVTTLMRYDWGKERKENAVASYGGSSSPDYRRNILGEPGAGASQYFVTARVMACTDQRIERPPDAKGSDYNVNEYVKETFRFEEMESLGMSIADSLDLPAGENYKGIWGGVDIGLTESPTVISLFAEGEWEKKERLALVRKFTLERFRPKEIRQALFTIGWHFGAKLLGVGIDITGIGLPLYQDMGDDELAPQHLLDVTVGYTFNSTIPVEVDPKMCTESNGVIRDQYGAMVKREEDEITGDVRYIAMMPFIAASTRELRSYVDATRLLLPFDTDVIADMLGETKQRVERIGSRAGQGTVKKGDRFHILDSFRAMAMRTRSDDITAKLAQPQQQPVLERA